MKSLKIGTRGSRLALWQANFVASRLRPVAAPQTVEIIELSTAGDQFRDAPLSQIGGEGVFTKEIQRAVLTGLVDVAVHSLKDLPTFAVEHLILAAVPARGQVGDVLVSKKYQSFAALPRNAIVATSSVRRRAQVLARRPDLRLVDIRGNVDTRLRKLDEENLDALILAQAGLERLNLGETITEVLHPSWMLPAVGQGALGLECRVDDPETRNLLQALDDRHTHQLVLAERSMLRGLGGGCQVPIGVHAEVRAEILVMRGAVIQVDGKSRVEATLEGPLETAESLGQQLAQLLLARGADKLLER